MAGWDDTYLGSGFDSFPVGLAVFDVSDEFTCVRHNRAYLDLLGEYGRDTSSVVGLALADFISAETVPAAIAVFKRVRDTGETAIMEEYPVVMKPETRARYFQWSLSPIRIDGTIRWMTATAVEVTSNVQARMALADKQKQLDLAIQAARIGIWDWSLVTQQVQWLGAMESLYGLEPGSFASTYDAVRDLTHPDDEPRLTRTITEAASTGLDWTEEWRVIRNDGSIGWVTGVGRFVPGPDGAPARMIGAAIDITARRELEAAVREQAERFEVTLASIGDAVMVTDNHGIVTFMNPVARRLTGWDDDAIGQPMSLVFPIENELTGQPVESPVTRVLETGRAQALANHTILVSRDGRRIPIDDSAAPITFESGAVTGVVLVFRDVSDRRTAEAALEARERRFRALIEHGNDAIALLGLDGLITYASPSTTALLGYELDEFVGHLSTEFGDPGAPQADPDVAQQFLATPGATLRTESRTRHKDGSWRWMDVTITNMLHEPAVGAFVANYRDVTGRIEAEQERRNLLAAEREARASAERIAQRSQRLFQLATALSGAASPDDVGQAIIDHGNIAYGADAGSLAWLNAQHTGFSIRNFAGYTGETIDRYREFPLTPGLPMSDVVRTGEPIFREHGFEDAYVAVVENGHVVPKLIRAFAAAPVRLHGQVTAVIGFSFVKDHSFDAEERLFLATVAEMAGQALERAHAYEAEQHALQAVQASEARYRELFDGVADAVIVMDEDGRYLDANPATQRLFGYTVDELRDLRIGTLFGPDVLGSSWEETRSRLERGPIQAEGNSRRKDGSQIRAELFLTVVDLPEGRHYLQTIRDLTDRQAAAERARQLFEEQSARQLAEHTIKERDRFFSIAAHELRTPVAGVRGHAELLQRLVAQGRVTDDHLNRYSAAIIQGTSRLTRLINDLLSISRLQRGALPTRQSEIQLDQVVARTVERFRDLMPPGQQLTVSFEPATMFGDADRLDQVFTNLVENASKYSAQDGHIDVTLTTAGGYALICVRDDGIGVPEVALSRIFEPFLRAENTIQVPGLGLGLYICKQIVDAHDGRIWMESDGEGTGTLVTVELPTTPS